MIVISDQEYRRASVVGLGTIALPVPVVAGHTLVALFGFFWVHCGLLLSDSRKTRR